MFGGKILDKTRALLYTYLDLYTNYRSLITYMKKKLGILLLIVVALGASLAFTACANEDLYGMYESTDYRCTLVLSADSAVFSAFDQGGDYTVSYGADKICISNDANVGYEFTINSDGTLTLVNPYDDVAPIIFVKIS